METLTACFMSIAESDFSRSGAYKKALRAQGTVVLECIDGTPGMKKFWKLWQKYRRLPPHDVLVVSYPSYIAVPFARLISRKPVVFDAGWSLYEGEVISRGKYAKNPLGRCMIWLIDWLAYACADRVLLETQAQVEFYARLMRGRTDKCKRLFTGANEDAFYVDPEVEKRERFTAIFRGKYNPEAGLEDVVEAARLLEGEGVDMLIMSPGFSPKGALPRNVELDLAFYSQDALRQKMLPCHASLGQLARHERLERTIPHKAFESMRTRIPYVTARSQGVSELFNDGENCLMVNPGDPRDIAQKLLMLKKDPALGERLAISAERTYEERCSWDVIGKELTGHLWSVSRRS